MKNYICKYCNKIVLTDYELTRSLNNKLILIDHLMLRHRNKLDEFGSIYLNDIPQQCYILEVGENGRKNTAESPVLHSDFI